MGAVDVWVYAGVFCPAALSPTMDRRHFIAGLGGLTAALGLAGCLTGPGAGPDTPSPEPPTSSPPATPTPEPTDSGDHPVTPAETSFQVLDRSCGQGGNAATVSFGEGSVTVEGTIGGRDTCDTAELASASLHLDVLEVVVAVVEEDPDATVACAQCLTDIEYVFRAADLGDGPARVRVVHETADGRETVTVADRP